MTCVLSALRANKQLLKQNLSIFLDDPTMDWIIDSKHRQGGAKGSENGGKEGSAGDVSFLEERMKVLDSKLDGEHPCDIMKRELQSNTWEHVKRAHKGLNAILERARRSHSEKFSASAGCGGAFDSGGHYPGPKLLNVGDQVILCLSEYE